MEKMETVKGFKDVTGEEAEKREIIMEIIKTVFQRYGFAPAETPIIEYEEFARGNNSNDEAVRDIFKLEDRGKRKLALRYEFTFQLKRIAKNKKLPYKRFQIGYNFRDEPIRPGRTRQFIQCDADVIGSTVKDEADCLAMTKEILSALKIENVIYVNNRKLLDEILESEGVSKKDKEQVIRELDKLDKLTEKEVKENLKKFSASKIVDIMKKPESYFKKYKNYSEVEELKNYCKFLGVEIEFRPFLARGFSYYNGSVFEVWSKKLPVSICGGGSYLIDGNQSTGISFGLEPLTILTNMKIQLEKFLVVSLDEDKKAIEIATNLRKAGKNVSMYYGKPGKSLEYANSYNIGKVVFVGKKEIEKKKITVKDMITGKEITLTIEKVKEGKV